MRKSIRLYIRKSDIQKGDRCDSNSCPVARALKRKIKKYVDVDSGGVYLKGSWTRTWVPSNKAHDFICAFDAGREVKPCKLTLLPYKCEDWES